MKCFHPFEKTISNIFKHKEALPSQGYGVSVMLWMLAIAVLAIFVLATSMYKRSGGMMLVAANPIVSLGSATLLVVTGIVLWKMKRSGVFLFTLVGVLVIVGIIKRIGLFTGGDTTSAGDLFLLGGVILSYSSMVFELWREIGRYNVE